MAYNPPSYNNITIGEDLSIYTPPVYNSIVISEADAGIGRYTVVLYQNHMITISDTLLGTGLSPIVVMSDGERRTRQSTEGIPLVMINNQIKPLPEEDYLII